MHSELLVDMDGVIVNFVRGAFIFHNRFDLKYEDVTWDFDKTLFPDDVSKFWEPLGFEFWATLPWLNDGKTLLGRLLRTYGADNICLCTSPASTIGSIEGKIEWIRREVPQLARNFMVCPVKHFAAGPKRILVDDNDKNCERFREAGGKAVLVPQPWNKNKAKWFDGVGFNIETLYEEIHTQWVA